MRVLADTRRMPLELAAAVYEMNAADADYIRGLWPLMPGTPMWNYRNATEKIMFRGFDTLHITESLGKTLAAATDRIRGKRLPGIPRAALDALTGIYMELTGPDYPVDEDAPLHLVHALEDTCEWYGVISADERTTCAHRRFPAHCARCL